MKSRVTITINILAAVADEDLDGALAAITGALALCVRIRPPRRWQRFVNDVALFFDNPFCAVAAALGWGHYDLFGADEDRPVARIDHAGLLWLLNGDKLAAPSENTATIETRTGARHTCHRKPNEPGRAVAWELGP